MKNRPRFLKPAAIVLALSIGALLAEVRPARAALTFRWFGVSGFVLTDGKSTLLFDPAVTPTPPSAWLLPFQKVRSDEREFAYWADRCGISRLDATFVNHTHTDHALDAPTAVKKFGGLLIGSSSLRQIGRGHGIPDASIRVAEGGDAFDVGAFRVQAFETPHSPHFLNVLLADGDITEPLRPGSSAWDYRVGKTLSYWITHPEGKILFQAPGRVPQPDVLSPLRPDTLLMTIANRVSSEDLLKRRVLPSGASLVIPLHWDDFFQPLARTGAPIPLWFQNPGEFHEVFHRLAPRVRLEWPEYCRAFEVGRVTRRE